MPLVEEVKRLGKGGFVMFFSGEHSGLHRELRLTADVFADISEDFLDRWRKARS
jgi:hypothetical protein